MDDRMPPDLPARVAALEADMRQVKDILVGLDTFVRTTLPTLATREALAHLDERMNHLATKAEVAELRGKVSQLPTLWQIIPAIFAIQAGVIAIAVFLFSQVR